MKAKNDDVLRHSARICLPQRCDAFKTKTLKQYIGPYARRRRRRRQLGRAALTLNCAGRIGRVCVCVCMLIAAAAVVRNYVVRKTGCA